MAILIDWNNAVIGSIFASAEDESLDMRDVRTSTLAKILEYRSKYSKTYGEIVICCDSKHSWRKDVFPYYKANRKKTWENMKIDKQVIFDCINTITQEMRDHFRYKVLLIDGAEGDDIIATLCRTYHMEKNVIISSDKDFIQLQKFGAKQYTPYHQKMMPKENHYKYLKEHILRGDSGDGVPNFLSPDDILVTPGTRQKSVMAKKVLVWMDQTPEEICETPKQLENYKRNEQLIDLCKTPLNIVTDILTEFNKEKIVKGDLLNYFIKHKLRNLTPNIGEF